MALRSKLFAGDPRLEPCAVSDPAHITPGSAGDHVSKIQQALIAIDGLSIDAGELASKRYGQSTAAAVLAFKRKRNIIRNQTQVDNIVGILTIKALDAEMFAKEQITPPDPGPLPPLPAPPEPLSNQFAIRAAGRLGVFIITEKTDGDPTTVITNEVPICYQVFDLINNRRALYSFVRPGRGNVPEELLPPSAFARTPRQFNISQSLPLSGLACICRYITRVSATTGPGPSRLELRLASGSVNVPMIIHLGDAFPISGPAIETATVGAFAFRKFGFDLSSDS
jgi:hypothetical protein